MKKKIRQIAPIVSILLLVTACDVGSLNASYELTVNKSGTVSGVLESEFTPERTAWYERDNSVSSAIVINEISYSYNLGTCQIEDLIIGVTASNSERLILENISLANLEFENLDHPLSTLGYVESTPDSNQYAKKVTSTNLETGCVDPGAYIPNSGFVTTTERVNGPSRLDLGLDQWNSSAEVNVAISNIHPADRPYFYALESMCASGDFGTCINPAELGDELLTLLDEESDFTSATSRRWERGEFPTFLADNGFETYRTDDGGHGVRRYFNNKSISTVFRATESDYAAIPGWTVDDADGLIFNVEANYTNWLRDDDIVTDFWNESEIWRDESHAKTHFSQTLKVNGLILDTNGVYTKKTNKLSWEVIGFGSTATKTATQPLTTLIPGLVITFEKNSSKLTSATKKLLKKNKALLRGFEDTRVVGITDSSLDPDRAVANQTLATNRALAVANYMKNKLKLNFIYGIVTKPSSDSGSSWAKASVNKVVISPYGLAPLN